MPNFSIDLTNYEQEISIPLENATTKIIDISNSSLNKIIPIHDKYYNEINKTNPISSQQTFQKIINNLTNYASQENIKIHHSKIFDFTTKSNVLINDYYFFGQLIVFGFGLLIVIIASIYSTAFHSHSCCSFYIASTSHICPSFLGLIIFSIGITFTIFGTTFYRFSNNTLTIADTLIDETINILKDRTFYIPSMNISTLTNHFINNTDNYFFKFPSNYQPISTLLTKSLDTGLNTALSLNLILNISQFTNSFINIIDTLNNYLTPMPKEAQDIQNYLTNFVDEIKNNVPHSFLELFNYSQHLNEINQSIQESCNITLDNITYTDVCPKTRISFNNLYNNFTFIVEPMYNLLYNLIDQELFSISYNFETIVYNPFKNSLINILNEFKNVINIFNQIPSLIDNIKVDFISGPYSIFSNFFFHDITSLSVYLSLFSHLFLFGMILMVLMLCIRRRGMYPKQKMELSENIEIKQDTIQASLL